jgi:hypothetical protein
MLLKRLLAIAVAKGAGRVESTFLLRMPGYQVLVEEGDRAIPSKLGCRGVVCV